MAEQKGINALGREAAYQLANVTKRHRNLRQSPRAGSAVFSIIRAWNREFTG